MRMLQELGSNQYSTFSGTPDGATLRPLVSPVVTGWDAKRAMDVVGASVALILFAPILAFIYVVLMFFGGDPIFAQRRVGRNGELFACYKFRSMVKDASKALADYLDANPNARDEWGRSFK